MRLSQFINRAPKARREKARPERAKPSVATHGAFLPIVSLWGGAMFGLVVIVIPQALIDRVSAVSGGVGGDGARLIYAGVAALVGIALAFVIGGAMRSGALKRDSQRPLATAVRARSVQPIDPANELGSASLDAPLERSPFAARDSGDDAGPDPVADEGGNPADSETASKREPTLGELAQRGYELKDPDRTEEQDQQASGDVAITHKQFQRALIESCEGAACEVPRELDLAEFAALPGRNAVWVTGETDASSKSAQPDPTQRKAPRPVPPPASALEKLRQTPAEDLSLVQMVERFAGALHEHQQAERARGPQAGTGRDAALVEALKALTMFTEHGFDPAKREPSSNHLGETERELRNALAKLQTLRGAA